MARIRMTTTKETCIENSGLKNLSTELLNEYKDEEAGALLSTIAPIFKRSIGSPTQDRKPNWTPDELRLTISEYFDYFALNGLKPSKSSLRLWLNVGRDRYNTWERERTRYGEISDIISLANDVFETQYINRGEKHPTMNTFLLKSSHGHNDTQKIEVTAVNRVERNDIEDAVKKLKLGEENMEIVHPDKENRSD